MKIHFKLIQLLCAFVTAITSFSIIATTPNHTLLLRQPDVNGSTLVFTYGQEIWKTDLNSLNAKRITSFQGQASNPMLSPNGKLIAYTGEYSGSRDVFIVPVNGGTSKQLTWHPGADVVKGWSSDGKYIIFSSGRDNAPRSSTPRFWKVSIEGTTPTPLPMLRAETGSMSPDQKEFVYQKVSPWDDGWRRYRGGQNNPLRIVNLNTLAERKLPWNGEKVTDPRWDAKGIYFLSDENDVVNVFKFDKRTKQSTQLTKHRDYDVKSYGVDGDQIVYEQHGRLFQFKNGKSTLLDITIAADFPWVAPHWEDVTKQISSANISPNGKRALFVARGEVFSAPAKDADIRNISNTAARELSATWSYDGKSIAWFTDLSGEYRIVISDQFGKQLSEIKLAEEGFYYDLTWAPDGKKLLYTDQKQRTWWLDLKSQKSALIAQDNKVIPDKLTGPKWSPDSNWIAYVKTEANFLRNIYIYSLKKHQSYLVSNNMADNLNVVWDREGKYLFFTASTNFASKAPWLDLSIEGKKQESYGIYAAILSNETSSPIQLKQVDETTSDESEEKPKDNADDLEKDNENTAQKDMVITLDNLSDRIVPIPVEPALISRLSSISNGLLYLSAEDEKTYSLMKYDFKELKEETINEKVSQYYLASNGKAVLVEKDNKWMLVEAVDKLKKAKPIKLELSVWLEPKKEWLQKFHDAWRYQRDFFYVENIHGANWQQVYKDYLPLVAHVNHPADLTYLLDNLGAETSVGHSFTRSGKLPKTPKTQVGLLGIDVALNNETFIIDKIYTGEKWNSSISNKAPFTNLLDKVFVGDAIIAVNGKALSPSDNFYQAFNGSLNKQTRLTIAKKNNVDDVFDVWVKPSNSESALRQHAWIENNRRYVDKTSNGQLAYIWVPNTSTQGYEYFNRYFFAQADKKGAVIDERYNNGGSIADYFIDVLNRKLSGYFNNQFNPEIPLTSPGSIIEGPKVLLINEMAGSGGDMFPYLFRFHNIGQLVGKKTWGGLVGIWGVPPFIDGGRMTAPRSGFYDLNGNWKVENEGVAPDVEVDENLLLSARGIDAQLKKAVEVAMKALSNHKENRQRKSPADPIRAVTH